MRSRFSPMSADVETNMRITFSLPPRGASPYLFRCALIESIRDAIAAAQIAGDLDEALAMEAFRALPMPSMPSGVANNRLKDFLAIHTDRFISRAKLNAFLMDESQP